MISNWERKQDRSSTLGKVGGEDARVLVCWIIKWAKFLKLLFKLKK